MQALNCKICCSHSGGCRRRHLLACDAVSTDSAFHPLSNWILLCLFSLEDGGDVFLRNLFWFSTDSLVLYPNGHFSWDTKLFSLQPIWLVSRLKEPDAWDMQADWMLVCLCGYETVRGHICLRAWRAEWFPSARRNWETCISNTDNTSQKEETK
jgi:hypothetical protein